ncbi:MAG: hypothetical protein NT069_30200, partial [Planctomycetota bacterium]|nr:hypothetical protein [Planctomycetota bacterium]
MNTAPSLYRIVVFATPEDRLEVASVLRECLSLLPTDAAIQARLLPGVVNGEYPRESAERAAVAISELGPHAEAIPTHLVPVLHPCETPRHLRWPVGELQIVDARGEIEQRIAWDDVELVSVGQVPLDSTRHNTPRSTAVIAAGRHVVPEGNSTSPLA